MVHEARATVRILHRVEHNNAFGQNSLRPLVSTCGEQVISSHQSGVSRGNLVAMHAIGEPRHRQRATIARTPCGQRCKIGLYRVDARHVLRAGNQEVVQRAPFPALCILHHSNPVRRRFDQSAQIAVGFVGRGDAVARRVPDGFGQGRNCGVEIGIEIRLRLCDTACDAHGQTYCQQCCSAVPDQVPHHKKFLVLPCPGLSGSHRSGNRSLGSSARTL